MKPAHLLHDRKTMALAALGAVLACWVYVAYLIQPLMRQAAAVGRQVRAARERVKQLRVATTDEPRLRGQVQAATTSLTRLRGHLPVDEELSLVIEELSNLARQAHVKIQTIMPRRSTEDSRIERAARAARKKAPAKGKKGAPAPTAATYHSIPIEIEAVAGFHEFGAFLSLVEAGEQPMEVSTLHIFGDPKAPRHHHVTLVLRAYFAK